MVGVKNMIRIGSGMIGSVLAAVCIVTIVSKSVLVKKIKPWIIINFLIFSINIITLIVLFEVKGINPSRIGQFFLLCFNLVYMMGILTIHYNITLETNLSHITNNTTTNESICNNSTPANDVNMWTTIMEEKIGFYILIRENATIL